MGETFSANFSVLNAAQPTRAGPVDGFVASYGPTGVKRWATYLGGSADEIPRAIAAEPGGTVHVAGQTGSCDFPVLAAVQPGCGGGADAFSTRYDTNGVMLLSTHLGGSGEDYGFSVAVDAFGSSYVSGRTHSTNFPIWNPLKATMSGFGDAFATKIGPGGALLYSTYLGGSGLEDLATIPEQFRNSGIAGDANGAATVVGMTDSDDFPLVGAFQPFRSGDFDGFVLRLTPDGQKLAFSSYLGGTARDFVRAVALAPNGDVFVAGETSSTNFPATAGSFQPMNAGMADGFVARVGGPPQCSDGIDDEGKIDLADPQCTAPWKNESPPHCGLGAKLAALLSLGRAAAGRGSSLKARL